MTTVKHEFDVFCLVPVYMFDLQCVCVCMHVFVYVCVCYPLLSVFFLGYQLGGNEKLPGSKLDFNEDGSLPAKSSGMKLADWTHWSWRVPALEL